MLNATDYPDQDLRPHICIIGSEKDGEEVLEVMLEAKKLTSGLLLYFILTLHVVLFDSHGQQHTYSIFILEL